MQKEIKQTWQFTQSPEEVWEYLTEPELIEQWLMKTDFRPSPGHKFQFFFTPKPEGRYEGRVQCEVLEVSPYTRLSYSWNGNSKDSSFQSTVVWTLVPSGKGTELRLEHGGFELLEDVLTHTSGWNSCLKKLETQINLVKQ